jgi:hypothetical protein
MANVARALKEFEQLIIMSDPAMMQRVLRMPRSWSDGVLVSHLRTSRGDRYSLGRVDRVSLLSNHWTAQSPYLPEIKATYCSREEAKQVLDAMLILELR